jgi:hypothetical protein
MHADQTEAAAVDPDAQAEARALGVVVAALGIAA